MNSKPRERFVDVDSGRRGRDLHAAWGNALKPEQVNGVLDYVLTTFTKEPAPRTEAAQRAGHEPGSGERRLRQAWRADLPAALHRLPRPQGRRQRTQLARYPAAPAQSAQLGLCRPASTIARLFDSDPLRRAGHRHAGWIDYGLSQERRRRHCELHPQHQSEEQGASSMPDSNAAAAATSAA